MPKGKGKSGVGILKKLGVGLKKDTKGPKPSKK